MNKTSGSIGILVRSYWPYSIGDKYRYKGTTSQYLLTSMIDLIEDCRLYHLIGVDRYSDQDDYCYDFSNLFKKPYFAEDEYVTE